MRSALGGSFQQAYRSVQTIQAIVAAVAAQDIEIVMTTSTVRQKSESIVRYGNNLRLTKTMSIPVLGTAIAILVRMEHGRVQAEK